MEEQREHIEDRNQNEPQQSPVPLSRIESCSGGELASRGNAVRQMVIELEEAHATGDLGKLIEQAGLDSLLGSGLLGHYQHLHKNSARSSAEFRQYWVNYALDAFSLLLRPAMHIYEAQFDESCSAPETNSVVSKSSWKLIVPHFGRTEHVHPYQIESCRYWGVWFNLGDSESDVRITSYLLSAALRRLTSDLSGIAQMERALLQGGTKLDEARMEMSGCGPEFARLIHDVLNENEHVAHFPRLIEDLMERTDLRLRYTGLSRKHGARAQISFASRKEHHINKRNHMHLSEEYVFISPYGIAQTVIHKSSMPFMGEIDWHTFWILCGVLTDEIEVLAGILKKHFNQARYRTTDHPMGPVGLLHPEIKRIIRAIAHHAAFAATNNLRWRELKRGMFLPTSRRKGRPAK